MRLQVSFLKEMMQNAAGSIALKIKAIKCATDKRCQNAFIRHCNMQDGTQTQTFPSRRIIVRPEKCYTLINSSKLSVKRADYLGQAILKTQSKEQGGR